MLKLKMTVSQDLFLQSMAWLPPETGQIIIATNFLFRRTRDNCQILTKEDPVLLLTGPSRAVVLAGLVTFEVQLMVKGKTESADEVLASKVFYLHQGSRREDSICTRIPDKHRTLEFALAPLRHSVEATVTVQLVDGSWPDGHQGQVFSCTDGIKDTKMLLLDCPDGRMPIGPDGTFELSRRVVCAELSGRDKLMVSVQRRFPYEKSGRLRAEDVRD